MQQTEPDRSLPLPLYYQVKQDLLLKIHEGEFLPGETIPAERELESKYKVSRITVRRALADLVSDGYLSRHSGRGTFVLNTKFQNTSSNKLGAFFGDLASLGYRVAWKVLLCEKRSVPHSAAKKLEIAEGKILLYLRRLVFGNDEPLGLTDVYFNIGEDVEFTREELEVGSIYPLLERKYGIYLHRAQKTLEATNALEDEAELLHTYPNAAMLLAEWVVYNSLDRPALFMKALYRGDRYKHYSQVTR